METKSLGQGGERGIIKRTRWPRVHAILRLALAPASGSCNVEHLLVLLDRINTHDPRRLTMQSIKMLLVVARDAALWIQYNYDHCPLDGQCLSI